MPVGGVQICQYSENHSLWMAVNFAYSGYDPNLYLFFIYLFLSKVYALEFSIKLSLFNSVPHSTPRGSQWITEKNVNKINTNRCKDGYLSQSNEKYIKVFDSFRADIFIQLKIISYTYFTMSFFILSDFIVLVQLNWTVFIRF